MGLGALSDRRPIGATGVALTRLGLGTAPLGNLFTTVADDAARATLTAAIDGGIGYLDTAPLYGFGLSERRIGSALAASAARPAISTKVGRTLSRIEGAATASAHDFVDADPYTTLFDYRGDTIERGLSESLMRLGRDRIDIVYVHDLGTMTHGPDHPARLREALDGAFPRLHDLKAAGLVGAVGLGVNEHAIADIVMTHADIDVVLLAGRHTLIDRTAVRDGFFDRCASRGTALVIGGVFNSGLLADPGGHMPKFDYRPAAASLQTMTRTMDMACRRHGVALGAAAIAFAWRHDAVTSILVGVRSPAEVAIALAWAAARVPDTLLDELDTIASA